MHHKQDWLLAAGVRTKLVIYSHTLMHHVLPAGYPDIFHELLAFTFHTHTHRHAMHRIPSPCGPLMRPHQVLSLKVSRLLVAPLIRLMCIFKPHQWYQVNQRNSFLFPKLDARFKYSHTQSCIERTRQVLRLRGIGRSSIRLGRRRSRVRLRPTFS